MGRWKRVCRPVEIRKATWRRVIYIAKWGDKARTLGRR